MPVLFLSCTTRDWLQVVRVKVKVKGSGAGAADAHPWMVKPATPLSPMHGPFLKELCSNCPWRHHSTYC